MKKGQFTEASIFFFNGILHFLHLIRKHTYSISTADMPKGIYPSGFGYTFRCVYCGELKIYKIGSSDFKKDNLELRSFLLNKQNLSL